ncbi:M23 family metallopeptidase [Sinorhizobium meliloti]|uniref:M23 family metallopeptidase n=1 Tax=Rhizobium meliloti TaxID=382 RepID=UPI003D9FD003
MGYGLALAAALTLLLAGAAPSAAACELLCPLAGTGCPTPTANKAFSLSRWNPTKRQFFAHKAVDYSAPRGEEVRASFAGRVEESRKGPDLGNLVVIRHPNGAASLYAHLLSRSVWVGARVKTGQPIGLIDNTGASRGDHLHFEYVERGPIILAPGRIDPHPCMKDTFKGVLNLTGTVYNSVCRANVPVRGTLDMTVVFGRNPILRARLRRIFGPSCFSYDYSFDFASNVEYISPGTYRAKFSSDADTTVIDLTFDEREFKLKAKYSNRHHFCCDSTNGASNNGPQAGEQLLLASDQASN